MNRVIPAAALLASLLAQAATAQQQLQSGGAQSPYIPYTPPSASVQTPMAAPLAPTPAPSVPAPIFTQPDSSLLDNTGTPGITAPLGATAPIGTTTPTPAPVAPAAPTPSSPAP